jgi:translin
MKNLDEIAEGIHQALEVRTSARDQALGNARSLIRSSANAIRAIHRGEFEQAQQLLDQAHTLVDGLLKNLDEFPGLYFAGYTQDALKEFAEAHLVYALVQGQELPTPAGLRLEPSTYLQGLAEAASELRRRCLDMLLHGNMDEAERVMGMMDDIYAVLVTMDYPDAITGGTRRLTDLLRSVTERTRGDLTLSLRQKKLVESIERLESKLPSE